MNIQARLSDVPTTNADRVRLLTVLANALISAEGYNGSRTKAIWNEIFALMERGDITLGQRIEVLTNATGSLMADGGFVELRDAFERLPRDELSQMPAMTRAFVAQCTANANMYLGSLDKAAAGMDEARQLIDSLPRSNIHVGGGTPEVANRTFMLRCAIMRGDFQLARLLDEELAAIVKRTEYLPARCWALLSRGFYGSTWLPPEETHSLLDEIEPIVTRAQLSQRIGQAGMLRGIAWLQQGRFDEGTVRATEGLEQWLQFGGRFSYAEYALQVAALLLAGGRLDAAERVMLTAESVNAAGDGRLCTAELKRLKAELLLVRKPNSDVKAEFIDALRTAMLQGAGLYAIHAIMSLHHHYGSGVFDANVRSEILLLRGRLTGEDHSYLREFRCVISHC